MALMKTTVVASTPVKNEMQKPITASVRGDLRNPMNRHTRIAIIVNAMLAPSNPTTSHDIGDFAVNVAAWPVL